MSPFSGLMMGLTPGPALRHRARWLLVPIASLASACGLDAGPNVACTAVRSIAIEADVTDSASGLARADSAAGFVQAGTYWDSLRQPTGSSTLLIGGEQLGTYGITISRPGYTTWTRSGVAVTQKGVCGNVLPVHLVARLQPGP